jgi:hypothetical protein
MINQIVTKARTWHQTCLKYKQNGQKYVVILINAMSKTSGWAKQAENQGAATLRRTPPKRLAGARVAIPGPNPAGWATAVGLVSPPGGIVLWDEWNAALKKRRGGKDPEGPEKPGIPADNLRRQPPKEVRGDHHKD